MAATSSHVPVAAGGPAPAAPSCTALPGDATEDAVSRTDPAQLPRGYRWLERWPLRTYVELAALDTAPRTARARVRAVMREWQADDDTAYAVAQVVTELLANAVEATQAHRSPAPVRLWILGCGTSVMALVWDATTPAPVLRAPAADAEHGRGLVLVQELSGQWGYYHPQKQPHGKVVWAVLPATPGTAASATPRVPTGTGIPGEPS